MRSVRVTQSVPFTQPCTAAAQITANDVWTGVPGIQGFLGQDITTATGVDPQTLLTTSTAATSDLDVIANQSSPSLTNGRCRRVRRPCQPDDCAAGLGHRRRALRPADAAYDGAVHRPRRLHAARRRRLCRRAPFLTLNVPALRPGETWLPLLRFANPGRVPVTFTPRLLSGAF